MKNTDLLYYIKGKLEGMEKKLDTVCNNVNNASEDITKIKNIEKTLNEHGEKIAKHDVIFGKIGVIITTGIFIVATGINILIDWIRSRF